MNFKNNDFLISNFDMLIKKLDPLINKFIGDVNQSYRDDYVQDLIIFLYNILQHTNFQNLDNAGSKLKYIQKSLTFESYKLQKKYNSYRYISLDKQYNNNSSTLLELFCEPSSKTSIHNMTITLEDISEYLTIKQYKIIEAIYFKGKTEIELSRTLNCSQQNISYHKKNAINKIKEAIQKWNVNMIEKSRI